MTVYRKLHETLTPRERRIGWMLVGLSIVGMLLETFGIGMIIPSLALMTQEDPAAAIPAVAPLLAALGNPGQAQLIMLGAASLGIIFLVKTVYLAFLFWLQTRFAFSVRARLAERLFSIYLAQPYTFHLQHNSAYLIRNAQYETTQFVQGTLQPMLSIMTDGLLLIGLSALLLVVEPIGAIAVVSTIGFAAWSFHAFTRARVTRWGRARRRHEGERLRHIQQGLGSVKDLKLMGREDEFLRAYRFHNRRAANAARLQTTLNHLPRIMLELLAVLGLVVLVLAMLAQGRDMSTVVPVLGAFAAAAMRMLPSTSKLVQSAQSIRFSRPVIDDLHRELKGSTGQPRQKRAPAPGDDFTDAIELEQVSFSYAGADRPALDAVSLKIGKGECVGFVGASGSGKSTAIDVLLGLLQPEQGRVRVDGVDIRDDLRRWQNQIGYVPQSIYLTDDSLRRNIAFGVPAAEIDEPAVERAVEAAQLTELVASLPDGLDTTVGERGTRLSGGQRQRIGIARSLYHDPAVLVLDEATSALDTETEREVMRAVNALAGSKTIIIVAHRLSTVEGCVRLFRLEQGRLADQGPPSRLLDTDSKAAGQPGPVTEQSANR